MHIATQTLAKVDAGRLQSLFASCRLQAWGPNHGRSARRAPGTSSADEEIIGGQGHGYDR